MSADEGNDHSFFTEAFTTVERWGVDDVWWSLAPCPAPWWRRTLHRLAWWRR